MDARKMKILEQLISHLSDSQGMDLKSLMDESKAPKVMAEDDAPEPTDGTDGGKPDSDLDDLSMKPKGLKIESVEVMGKPKMEIDKSNPLASSGKTLGETIGYPGSGGKMKLKDDAGLQAKMDPEMTDDEFEELLKKYA